jgi:hypothetical protein
LSRQDDEPSTGDDPADALYAGRKAHLRPIHDAVMRAILGLGGDPLCPRDVSTEELLLALVQ